MALNQFLTLVNGVRQYVTGITASAGAADANKLISTDGTGRISQSLLPIGVGSNASVMPSSEALAAGDFINIYSNGGVRNCRKADASNNRPAHGFVISAVALGANATVYQTGENTALTGLAPGSTYFLSATTAGTGTTVAPSATGQIVQDLGFALSTTSILFEYDSPIYIV